MVKFSIVVVCLNAGERLKMTIESILAQSCGDYEIVVKDGMSTDGSVEALPKDSRIRILREKDKGIYDAMNQAVEKVSGEYVYFLNCGDVFYDAEVLSRVKEKMMAAEERGAEQSMEEQGEVERSAAGQRSEERFSSGKGKKARFIFYGDIHEHLTGERVASNPSMDAFGCYRNVPCHQACFYAAELMREKQFELRYKVRADYEHFLWCFFEGKAKTVYMPLLIADYEGGGFSETKANLRCSAQEHKQIVRTYMPAGQVFKYKAIMVLTLSGIRTWLARNKATAHVYNRVKRMLYRR